MVIIDDAPAEMFLMCQRVVLKESNLLMPGSLNMFSTELQWVWDDDASRKIPSAVFLD